MCLTFNMSGGGGSQLSLPVSTGFCPLSQKCFFNVLGADQSLVVVLQFACYVTFAL